MGTDHFAVVSLRLILPFPESTVTRHTLNRRVQEREIAKMGKQEWRFIADFPPEGWVFLHTPVCSAQVAACSRFLWTRDLLRWWLASASFVPTECIGTLWGILLGKLFLFLQLSLGSKFRTEAFLLLKGKI